jgi:hypothetical protein
MTASITGNVTQITCLCRCARRSSRPVLARPSCPHGPGAAGACPAGRCHSDGCRQRPAAHHRCRDCRDCRDTLPNLALFRIKSAGTMPFSFPQTLQTEYGGARQAARRGGEAKQQEKGRRRTDADAWRRSGPDGPRGADREEQRKASRTVHLPAAPQYLMACRPCAGLSSGDGPLSVRARPSSIKCDCDRRTTGAGGRCPANVHAKSHLIPETSTGTPVERQGPGSSLPGPDAGHPLHSAGRHAEAIRVSCGPGGIENLSAHASCHAHQGTHFPTVKVGCQTPRGHKRTEKMY